MPELPRNLEDVVLLADWLELFAIESGDQNASTGDLVNALQIAVAGDKAEELAMQVVSEIRDRAKSAADAYPFVFERKGVLQLKHNADNYVAYLFCLLLSYFGWSPTPEAPVNPRLLFEDLACIAAKQYVQGEVFKFGTSRREGGVYTFREAIGDLCRKLGEGEGLRPQQTLDRKDDHVDLVAWRAFRDGRESKFVLFGQCATGENWTAKLSELDPEAFWAHWMRMSRVSPLTSSFFMPHRIADGGDGDEWRYHARYAGILFDRCRVAYWAWTDNERVLEDPRYMEWCHSVFPAFSAAARSL